MEKRGFIPRDFIQNLVARADIVAVINMRVPLKKKGKNYTACCPFHEEKTPSFFVNESRQAYHCFGCGAKGTVINFLMEYEQLEFKEAVEVLASHEGMDVPYERGANYDPQKAEKQETLVDVLARASQFYQAQLRSSSEKDRAISYLKKRDISGEIAKRFGLGFAPSGWSNLLDALKKEGVKESMLMEAGLLSESQRNSYDRFRNRIMFPIRNRRGDTIGFGGRVLSDEDSPKYLNSPETPVFHKGSEVYGLYELRKYTRHYDEIIVVEGYMDVVMLAQYGIGNAVATLGTAIAARQIEMLLRYTSHLVFCFDGDRAGRAAASKALEESLGVIPAGKELSFLFLPEGEDPDSYVKERGTEAFKAAIESSDSLSKYLFESLKENFDTKTLEGRAAMLESAAEKINRMRDIPLRDLLREELAKTTEVSESLLERHVRKGRTPQQRRYIDLHQNLSITDRIVVLLLNDPSLMNEIGTFQFLLESDDRDHRRLYYIMSTLQDYPMIKNAAQLLFHFEEESWIDWLKNLSVSEMMLEAREEQLLELQDLLAQLAKQESPMKRVLQKLQLGEPLTPEDEAILRGGH